MKTPKTIAIIGATGSMGSAIAARLAKGNYHLLLMANEVEQLQELEKTLLKENKSAIINTLVCETEACWEADIIILATPYEAQIEIAERIKPFATGKIVIIISQLLNIWHDEVMTSTETSAAEELQKLLPNSKVVKTVTTKFPSAIIDDQNPDTFIAGNNGDAVEVVSQLVQAAGLNPVVAGDLTVSRTLEHMQLLTRQQTLQN